MTAISLDEIEALIDQIQGAGVQPLGEEDLTRVRYCRFTKVGPPMGGEELALLVKTGFLKIEQRRATNYRLTNVYIVVGRTLRTIAETVQAIRDQLAVLREKDPDWLHTNDMTSEIYAKRHGLTTEQASRKLDQLVKQGWLWRQNVRAPRRHSGIVVYRPTDKALAQGGDPVQGGSNE